MEISSSTSPSESLPKRSQRTLVMVVSALALVLLLCIGLGVFVLSRNLVGVSKAQADISPLLDTFMQAMVAHDTDRAYQLFSTRAQHHIAVTSRYRCSAHRCQLYPVRWLSIAVYDDDEYQHHRQYRSHHTAGNCCDGQWHRPLRRGHPWQHFRPPWKKSRIPGVWIGLILPCPPRKMLP